MDLTRLFRPHSIAVMGGGWAANVVEQCEKMGFRGDVWPVHPTKPEIGGMRAYRSLDELPKTPDATFVGVNRHATLKVVTDLARLGAGGAICFASGWSETGDAALQEALVKGAGDMPILGPNCYGLLNYLDGAAIWPDQHGGRRVETGVAIVSQSSNIAINLTMQRRGLPVGYVACLGNAAQSGPDVIGQTMLDDPRVTALGFYLEGIADAVALAGLAEAARAADKGVVALKSGKTEGAVRAAASHTAALAGDAVVSSAFLAQAGIAEVSTLEAFLETLKIFHYHGPLRGRRVAAAACSGGEAGLTADLAGETRLTFPDLANPARLSAVLGPQVALANPLDYQTHIWGDVPKTTEVFAGIAEGMDAALCVIDPPRRDLCDPSSFDPALRAIGAAARESAAPVIAVTSLPESLDEDLAFSLAADGVMALAGHETALRAVDAAACEVGRLGWRPWAAAPPRSTRLVDEAQAKALLALSGVAVPRGVSADRLDDLVPRARMLQGPVALKGLGFAHKTEADAVRLGLQSLAGQAEMPGATGYLAEEMVQGGVAEILVGVRRDQIYGATLTLGVGGVTAELIGDTQTLVLPVISQEIENALRRLRLWPLLDGHRGRAKPNIKAVVETALKLQEMLARAPALEEIEINPLIATETGAVAADALIREAT